MMTVLLLSTLGLVSQAVAQDAPPPIVDGSETSDFLPVGVILAYSESQGGFDFCSGTLIAIRDRLRIGPS